MIILHKSSYYVEKNRSLDLKCFSCVSSSGLGQDPKKGMLWFYPSTTDGTDGAPIWCFKPELKSSIYTGDVFCAFQGPERDCARGKQSEFSSIII